MWGCLYSQWVGVLCRSGMLATLVLGIVVSIVSLQLGMPLNFIQRFTATEWLSLSAAFLLMWAAITLSRVTRLASCSISVKVNEALTYGPHIGPSGSSFIWG